MVRVRADFSEAAQQGEFSPRHVEEGEYLATIKGATVGESKQGNQQVVFKLVSNDIRGASYPYYCSLDGKGSWKLRALLEAVGVRVKGAAVNFDTDRLVGKQLGMELLDDEYQGRMKSKVQNVFPKDELGGKDDDTEPEEDDLDEDEVEDEPEPPKRRAAAKRKPEPGEEEDEEEEEPAPKRRTTRTKAKPAPAADDDDDLDLDEI